MIQETSREAYENEIKPTLGERQSVVYEEICKHLHITNTELSQILGMPINTVTPRCKELRDMGYVAEWGKRKCKITGRNVIAWESTKQTLF